MDVGSIVWRCADCDFVAGSSDALLTHIWQQHAKDIITACPWIVEALWRSAARQHLNQQQVLRDTRP